MQTELKTIKTQMKNAEEWIRYLGDNKDCRKETKSKKKKAKQNMKET